MKSACCAESAQSEVKRKRETEWRRRGTLRTQAILNSIPHLIHLRFYDRLNAWNGLDNYVNSLFLYFVAVSSASLSISPSLLSHCPPIRGKVWLGVRLAKTVSSSLCQSVGIDATVSVLLQMGRCGTGIFFCFYSGFYVFAKLHTRKMTYKKETLSSSSELRKVWFSFRINRQPYGRTNHHEQRRIMGILSLRASRADENCCCCCIAGCNHLRLFCLGI